MTREDRLSRPKKEKWDKYFGKPMSCALCVSCYENPRNPDHCIYGGPYAGFKNVEAKDD